MIIYEVKNKFLQTMIFEETSGRQTRLGQ